MQAEAVKRGSIGNWTRRGTRGIKAIAFTARRPAARDAALCAPAAAPAATTATGQHKEKHNTDRAETAKKHEDSPLFLGRRIEPVRTPA